MCAFFDNFAAGSSNRECIINLYIYKADVVKRGEDIVMKARFFTSYFNALVFKRVYIYITIHVYICVVY